MPEVAAVETTTTDNEQTEQTFGNTENTNTQSASASTPMADAMSEPVENEYSWVPEKFIKDGEPDFKTLAKSYSELETKLRSTRPTAAKSPEEYQYEFPEEFPVDESETEAFKQEALKVGLSVDQYKFVMDKYFSAIEQSRQRSFEQAEKAITEMWGDSKDENLEIAYKGFQTIAEPLQLDIEEIGNDPNMLKVLQWIGQQTSEDSVGGIHGVASDPGMTDTEIGEIMSRPDYWTNQELQQQVQKAFELRSKRR